MANKEKQAENKEKIGIGAWLALIVLILVLSGAFRTAEGPIKVLDFTNLAGSFGQIGDTGANLIGKGGTEIEKLRQTCEKMMGKTTLINIVEVRSPDLNAQLVAESIAQQLEKRISFRRAMKMAIGRSMKLGAKGIKTQVSGRLGGAEIARTEQYHEGTIPLQTLRADIDYGFAEAKTTYGRIGVKTWIYRGEVLAGAAKPRKEGGRK